MVRVIALNSDLQRMHILDHTDIVLLCLEDITQKFELARYHLSGGFPISCRFQQDFVANGNSDFLSWLSATYTGMPCLVNRNTLNLTSDGWKFI